MNDDDDVNGCIHVAMIDLCSSRCGCLYMMAAL